MSTGVRWRWTDEQGVQRLVRTDELREALASGLVSASTLVWRDGMKEWVAASSLPELTGASKLPALDAEDKTDVLPQPEGAGRPEPQPKGKMPTLLGLGANDPRVSAARAAILAHEAAATKAVAKSSTLKAAQGDGHDSIFEDDSIETVVKGEPNRAPKTQAKGNGRPSNGGSAKGQRPPPRPLDRPPLTLPVPAGYAGKPGSKSAQGTKPPPPPKAAPSAPPARPLSNGVEAHRASKTVPGLASAAGKAPPNGDAAPPSTPATSARPTLPSQPSAAPEPTAKLPISELLDDEVVSVEPDAVEPAAHAEPPPPPKPAPRASHPSTPSVQLGPLSPVAPEAPAEDRETAAEARARAMLPTDPRGHRAVGEPVLVPISSLVGAGAALIVMVVGAFLAGRATAPGGLGPSEARVAHLGVGRAALAAHDAIPTPPKPCWVARQPVRWAPEVSKNVPFDVIATNDGGFAVGFARDAREAAGVDVDPVSGAITAAFSETATADLERIAPLPAGGKSFAVTTEGAALRSAVQVADEHAFLVGVHDGALSAADRDDATPSALWPLGEDGKLEALHAQGAGPRGFGLVMRRSGSIWGGWLGVDRKPVGELAKVGGSGGPVGKPMTGWNGRELAVVFADRPSDDAPWQIRIGHAAPPAIPATTTVIALPKGGPGGDAFAPGIAGLPDGRWLLVWTEGAPGGRAIRAQTLAADFSAVGDPIALSPPAGNFGQGIVAVSLPYAASVFLSKGASSYELWGAILQCG